jgi:hypothetical protein
MIRPCNQGEFLAGAPRQMTRTVSIFNECGVQNLRWHRPLFAAGTLCLPCRLIFIVRTRERPLVFQGSEGELNERAIPLGQRRIGVRRVFPPA